MEPTRHPDRTHPVPSAFDRDPLNPEALSAAERHQMLVEWNEPAEYPAAGLVPDLVAAQAARQPGAEALTCGEERISYRELEARAGRLAVGLRRLGVGPEVIVGVLLERSPDMVATLLAIWKCGGAYLPLDPDHPAGRMAWLLEDGLSGPGPRLVVTQRELAARIPAGPAAQCVFVEDVRKLVEVHGSSNASPLLPDSPAYVIYTSGSTGRPKGIVVSHRSLANRILWACATEMRPGDAFLHKTTLTFDVSVAEICVPLVAGGRCVLARPGGQRDLAYLADLIQRERITHASFPPATLRLLLDLPGTKEKLRSLRILVTGGETVPPDLPRRVRELLPATLYNRYGPTETTVSVLSGICGPEAQDEAIPLGRPIACARIYVLDDQMRPRPAMAEGELCIGGVCVARGYLGRPGLTAEMFVPDPFGGAGERLYRTGDRARWRPDGTVEFLGRIDHQVKIRGFRVELEEVEAVLAEHPGVRESAVVALKEAATGSCRLVAYLVAAREGALDLGGLRRFLGERLESHMIPSAFIELEDLPRTLSGKVDRGALRERAGRHGADSRSDAPSKDLEATLAGLFQELLEVPRVGTEESLFELGGHSLLLVSLQLRLRSSLGIEVRLADIARNPSVGALARFIESGACGVDIAPEQLAAEAELAPEIRPALDAEAAARPPRAVLLTGATGFLGAHLLDQLLARTWAQVYCLVRAPDGEAARMTLSRTMERYALWREDRARRIIPVPGDLSRPLLGLGEGSFQELAATVDSVYHCGAQVNLLYPYETLRAANVDGTREVLRFAVAGQTKSVHHISSLSVLEGRSPFRPGAAAEEPLDASGADLAGGYRQSKWVAERLVETARQRGVPAAIYRPGWITGHSATGIGNSSDFLVRLIVASIQLGAAPDLGGIEVCPTPVDYVSAAIVWLSLSRQPAGEVYHLINPEPVAFDHLIELVNDLGYPVEKVPLGRWAADLADFVENDLSELLTPLGPVLQRLISSPSSAGAVNGSPWRPLRFDSAKTRAALAPGRLTCPAIDRRFLEVYLDDLVRQGLIPPVDDEILRSVRC